MQKQEKPPKKGREGIVNLHSRLIIIVVSGIIVVESNNKAVDALNFLQKCMFITFDFVRNSKQNIESTLLMIAMYTIFKHCTVLYIMGWYHNYVQQHIRRQVGLYVQE